MCANLVGAAAAMSFMSVLHQHLLVHFDLVENLNIPKEQEDIIIFKKALYLLKTSKSQNGKELMQSIANSNSNLKSLAEDILSD